MKVFSIGLIVLGVLCFLAAVVLHFGTTKYERMNAGRLQMDPKKKRRISLGYWCDTAGLVLGAAGAILYLKFFG